MQVIEHRHCQTACQAERHDDQREQRGHRYAAHEEGPGALEDRQVEEDVEDLLHG
jgi:hypothetical protein